MVISEMLQVSCFQTAPRLLPTDTHSLCILLSPSSHYLIQIVPSKTADVLKPARFLSSSRNQSEKGHVKQQCDFWSYNCFYLIVSGTVLPQSLEQWDTSSLQKASLL